MGSSRVGRASLVLLLLIVVSDCAAGGRGLAEEKIQKVEHHNAVHKEGTTAPGSHPRNLMVKTNDYGRYDPTPAFSRPRFKPIPH
uniref:Uncharacterized protein n=1 Tax=Aegilops tauschii subsp. strangulata TaxID=200361 RepID=A0A452XS57_AEGTS